MTLVIQHYGELIETYTDLYDAIDARHVELEQMQNNTSQYRQRIPRRQASPGEGQEHQALGMSIFLKAQKIAITRQLSREDR